MSEDPMVSRADAEQQVKVVTQRLALLHLAYARMLVDEFGWNTAKRLILKSIKRYGTSVAMRVSEGHQSLPDYGFFERREGKPDLCELGKTMIEMGEPQLGSMYCLVDAAKTMGVDLGQKMVHKRCMILGDDECQFATLPTEIRDIEDFRNDRDWSRVDPLIADFLPAEEPRPDS